MGIITRYVLKEVATPFFASLFVFTGVLFLIRIIRLVELVVSRNVPISDTLLLFSYVIPRFLEIAIPMSLLIGTLLAFSRLSSDSELVVFRACGISLRQLAKPVLLLAIPCFFATGVISFYLKPWADYRLGQGVFEIAKMRASAGLVQGIFNELGPLTLYAERIEPPGDRLYNVLISDRRDSDKPQEFVAQHGIITSDDTARSITLRLYDGSIHRGDGRDYNLTYFDTNNVTLLQDELLADGEAERGRNRGELQIAELSEAILHIEERLGTGERYTPRRLATYRTEFQKRLVLPFACLFVAFIAMALGIQPSRGGRAWGVTGSVVAGILVIVAYYLLLAVSTAMSQASLAPPWVLMWIPNLLFAAAAYWLFRQMHREQPPSFQKVQDMWAALMQRLSSAVRAEAD